MDDKKTYLTQDEAISLGIPLGIPPVDADKNRIDKNRIDKNIYVQHQKDVEELFESLWKLYLRKEGKNQVSKKSKEELFSIGFEKVKSCIEKYAKEKEGCDKQYILMGSTFFNGRYKDYLEDEHEKTPDPPIEEPEPIDVDYQNNFIDADSWEED